MTALTRRWRLIALALLIAGPPLIEWLAGPLEGRWLTLLLALSIAGVAALLWERTRSHGAQQAAQAKALADATGGLDVAFRRLDDVRAQVARERANLSALADGVGELRGRLDGQADAANLAPEVERVSAELARQAGELGHIVAGLNAVRETTEAHERLHYGIGANINRLAERIDALRDAEASEPKPVRRAKAPA